MKLTIDEKQCNKHGLSLEEALLLFLLRNGEIEENKDNLLARQIIVLNNNHISVTQTWSDILDEIICDSSETKDEEARLLNLAKKMRECFPEGKMYGTAYYYRCNNREVVLKMKKFFMQYGQYSDEDIIDATKRFVASYKGEYRYMPLIKYFISKNKRVQDEDGEFHVQEVSELASYLENKSEESIPEVDNTDNWLMNSRN